jgi:hypothetical protein
MAQMTRMELSYDIGDAVGGTEHRVRLGGLPFGVFGPRNLFWRVEGRPGMLPPPSLDAFVWGVILPLSNVGGVLRVRGTMSRTALFNIQRLLDTRQSVNFNKYSPVVIEPDEVVDLPPIDPKDRSAALAFSGGVDSAHAAIRHAPGNAKDHTLCLRHLVMVHGFEVPLHQVEIFARNMERARPLANRLELDLVAVATNAKQLQPKLWPHTSAPIAATALTLFWETAQYGIFGGGRPYRSNFLPQGHQPFFDQFCSNGAFTLVTDGGGIGRTQKIRNIADVSEALSGLRVCWEGKDLSKNCGKCGKCVRTMLNMRMAGVDYKGIFEAEYDRENLRRTTHKTMYSACDDASFLWDELKDDTDFAIEAEILAEKLAKAPPPTMAAASNQAILETFASPGQRLRIRRARLAAIKGAKAVRQFYYQVRHSLRTRVRSG